MSTKQMNHKNTGPWYKHFWPWYIVFMKLAVLTAIVITAVIVKKNPTSMVIDDYYNEGRAINYKLDRKERALELDIKLQANVVDGIFTLQFVSGEPAQRTALRVMFYHPTLDDRDFDLLVPHASAGIYRTEFPTGITGHWRIDIEPFDQEWRISNSINLPFSKSILIVPEF
ncbi:FixH family protein [Aliidiomarina quisquiliarum]|uniref:FixH family protein n=1 Tax=Aliidiomarina quisquiliarum TaxID=2938947 RepID=UPI00208F637D|nr:FixH family protein [Aliidiomarina quisquiliarum]MCO4320652.1 FixH family protein [Aliidiomarina quisquiliarum]